MTKAIWIIGHGSSSSEWIQLVDEEIEKIQTSFPIIVSFLEKVEGRLINDGINELEGLQATHVLVIPLFVSTASTHITEVLDILMLYKGKFNFSMTRCMDDDDLVINHIIKSALKMSTSLNDKNLLLVAHGSDVSSYHQEWERILKNITRKVKKQLNINQVDYATFLPYTLMTKLNFLAEHQTIVIPLFLSSGIFTKKKIPNVIERVSFPILYNSDAYLSQNWIHLWISKQIDMFYSGKCDKGFLLL